MLLEGGLDWKTMSLSPRDLDFMEARHAAAREIALAIGVPPMLLGIPGDNTYANYAEANRAFWRQTVLPLVNRMARALGGWLGPAWSDELRLAPDLDQVEALTPEREALWARIGAADFLSDDEKRAAVGYGDAEEGGDRASSPFARKYRPDQARDEQGRWVEEGGGEDDEGDAEAGGEGGREGDESGDDSPESMGTPNEGIVLVQGDPLAGYPIDLREEERRGSHTIAGHVNMNPNSLTERVLREADRIRAQGDDFRGLAIGSFTSLESATRLVNSTVAQHRELADQVARGELPYAVIESRFTRETGYEAYLPSYHAQAYIRDTNGVRAIILRDRTSSTGFRVQSAFPVR